MTLFIESGPSGAFGGGGGPIGPAGGDLAGFYPNPTVVALNQLRALIGGPGDANRVIQSDGSGGIAIGTTSIARTITVSPLGRADELSIAAALTAAAALVPPPSPAAPVLILCGPGIFTEVGPLVIPSGVTVAGAGPLATTVVPTLATATVFQLAESSSLRNVAVMGASGAGGVGVDMIGAAGNTFIEIVSAIDCETGFSADVTDRQLVAVDCIARLTAALPGAVGIDVSNGAKALFFGVGTLGGGALSRLATGASCVGSGSQLILVDHRATECDEPSFTDDDGVTEIRGGLYDGAVNALHVGALGSPRLDFRTLRIENSTTFDVLIDTATAVVRFIASQFRDDISSVPAGTDFVGSFLANDPGTDAGIHVRGELVVGHYDKGDDAVFGEGDDTVVPMTVFSNSNGEIGAWVDNTADAASGTPYALLQGTGLNQTAYFGSDFSAFPHIDVDVTIAQVTGAGTYVFEYWNGVAWVEVPVMAADAEPPQDQFANDVFTRVAHEHIRFGSTTGWASRLLNGVTAFWMRYRITAAITSVPTVAQTKIGTNHSGFSEAGELEFFGTGEPQQRLLNTRQVQYPVVGSAPGSNNIAFSASFTLNYTNNRLVDGAIDSFGFVVPIRSGLDTSKPLTLHIVWIQDNNSAAGNVEFLVSRVSAEEGSLLNGTLVSTVLSTIVAAPAQQFRMNITRIEITAPTLLPEEELAFIVTRDARLANPNDTLAGNVSVVDFFMEGFFWK